MFDLGLGSSVSSVTPLVMPKDIEAVENSKISTFEMIPGNFSTDYDGALRDAFLRMLRRTGKKAVSYHIPFSRQDDFSDPNEKFRKAAVSRFRALLHEAFRFDCRIIVLHPSTELDADDDRTVRFAQLRKSMEAVEDQLNEYGMTLALELLPRHCLGNTLSDIEKILDGFSDTFGCCMDVNHLMGRYAQIPDMVRKLGKRLITLHLSDYDGIDERHWVPAPGAGVIDWKAFLAALRDIDYRGPFNFEVKCDLDKSPEERVRSIEESYDWLRSL